MDLVNDHGAAGASHLHSGTGPDLARPPYIVIDAQSAESVGQDMVVAFAEMAAMPACTSRVFATLMELLAVDVASPLSLAGARLAADIDSGGGGGHLNPYHNVRHFGEVMLGAFYIARLQHLPADATAEVVLAAMMHDYGHDGCPNGSTPFRLERLAVSRTAPLLAEAGMSAVQMRRLAALVLATEVSRGHVIAIACHARHAAADGPPPISHGAAATPAEAPELGLLADDALAAVQALVLCEADVLPSVGLTSGHALKIQAELSVEWDKPLDAGDKLRFIDQWLKRAVVSRFFEPNAQRLKVRLAAIIAEQEAALARDGAAS